MRIYDLMLFTFIFTVALSMISVLDIVPYTSPAALDINGQTTTDYGYSYSSAAEGVVNQPSSQIPVIGELLSFLNIVYQFVVLGIPKLMLMLAYVTIGIPFMLIDLGIPSSISWLISGIVYLIYGVGILQYAIGRNLADSE